MVTVNGSKAGVKLTETMRCVNVDREHRTKFTTNTELRIDIRYWSSGYELSVSRVKYDNSKLYHFNINSPDSMYIIYTKFKDYYFLSLRPTFQIRST